MVVVASRTRSARDAISNVARHALAALRGRGTEGPSSARLTRRGWIAVHIHLTHRPVAVAAGLRSLR